MSDSSMKSIRFDKYFALLEKLVPLASGFVVCDSRGMVAAAHGDPFDVSVSDYLHSGPCDRANDGQPPVVVNVLVAPDDRVLLRRDITSSAGNLVGALLARMDSELLRANYPCAGSR
jgi:hypothetical protein